MVEGEIVSKEKKTLAFAFISCVNLQILQMSHDGRKEKEKQGSCPVGSSADWSSEHSFLRDYACSVSLATSCLSDHTPFFFLALAL